MDLRIWSPFTDFEREWRLDMPKFFFGESSLPFRPSIDVIKSNGDLTVTAELPGVSAEEVDVSVDGNTLVLKGEKSDERELKEDDRWVHERSFGKFQRRIPLPDGVSADKIAATFKDGVLTVSVKMPDQEALEPQRIEVAAS